MSEIRYKTKGIIHSPFKEPHGTAIQSAAARDIEGSIEIFPEYAGAPSKAHTRQLVQIQHEERLAATSELNPTPGQVTGRCDAGEKGYQAAIYCM